MSSNGFSFIYDEREITLLDSLPQIYHPIYDYQGITNASGRELSDLYNGVKNLVDDQFIATASASTLTRWEKYLDITPNGTDTLEERRFRVLSKLNDRPPYTDGYLINKLDELCGRDYYRIFREYKNYRLIIEISLDSVANTNTVMELVKSIIPANIELVVRTFRTRHYEVGKLTHTQLAEYTHDGIKLAEILD